MRTLVNDAADGADVEHGVVADDGSGEPHLRLHAVRKARKTTAQLVDMLSNDQLNTILLGLYYEGKTKVFAERRRIFRRAEQEAPP